MLRFLLPLAGLAWCCLLPPAIAARYDGKLTIIAIDQQTQQPLVVRMELRNGRGRPVKIRPEGALVLDNYLVFDGRVTLELKQGSYTFLIEAGPEYQTRPGHFQIERRAEDQTEVALQRRVHMQEEGWWAGDLDVQQRMQDLPLLMQAARVNLVPQWVRENVRGKCQNAKPAKAAVFPNLGETRLGPPYALDYRRGGGLLLFSEEDENRALDVCSLSDNDASLTPLRSAKEAGATIVALTPFAWDLPLWVAEGQLDAVQIIHRFALANDVVDNEGWGRQRDRTFFPGKMGNGRWSETIYHHLLNCGIQLPPAAGSGSGANTNPVGTNRVYVQCGEEFSAENWFAGLRAGKVMVTNGPLLRTSVSGEPPGHQFQLQPGESRDFQIALGLAFYEKAPVDYLEIVKNGRVEHEIRLSQLAQTKGQLPALHFDASGWFVVRAMTSTTGNYQFATTGPYYVQANNRPRISRTSVQFFLDWLTAAKQTFADQPAVLAEIAAAQPFWNKLYSKANVD